ncbi:MAG: NAD(P)/FAD-dependent oxidoreductase [Candidatus Binataceae bacterium]
MPISQPTFDVVVVGARVAGTAAAILFARAGLRVMLVDKATFPSDTISTHIVLGGGAAVLGRMGVLSMLESVGATRFGRMRTVGPDFDYCADLGAGAESDARGLCLGRIRMDSAMLDAARSLDNVTVREGLRVTDLLIENRAVAGVRGEDSAGVHEFTAPLVVGAGGMRSAVAQIASERLGAFPREDVPCARAYYYAYLDGVPAARLGDEVVTEFESSPGAGGLVCRCEDGRVVGAVAFDARELQTFRSDLTANFSAKLGQSLAVGRLLGDAHITGKIRSSGYLRNTYRDPACDGALLLGDSGLHVDPLFGQGHSFALISAELAAALAPKWFGARDGSVVGREALCEFTRARDRELLRYYQASVRVSRERGLDEGTSLAHRAACREQWAGEEMVRFAQMLTAENAFPSFRFARLMARERAASAAPHAS